MDKEGKVAKKTPPGSMRRTIANWFEHAHVLPVEFEASKNRLVIKGESPKPEVVHGGRWILIQPKIPTGHSYRGGATYRALKDELTRYVATNLGAKYKHSTAFAYIDAAHAGASSPKAMASVIYDIPEAGQYMINVPIPDGSLASTSQEVTVSREELQELRKSLEETETALRQLNTKIGKAKEQFVTNMTREMEQLRAMFAAQKSLLG
jgi:hypothetical protein